MSGTLVPIGGGDPIPLTKDEIIVGRHKSCDIVLNYSNVSSKHCKLVLSEGYWYVLDLQSTNGVKVNGGKVTDYRVDPGATLNISTHPFKLRYDPKRNGASGLPPANMLLQGDDILSQSLMQRAGLEKAKPPEAMADEVEPESPEHGSHAPSSSVHHVRRDFFSELVFD